MQREVPLWIWVVFILGIDVSHVWSTLFRTYLDKDEFKRHQYILTYTPVICFIMVFAVVNYSTGLFWRLLAYFALFHFIKQQYGFLALYKARAGHFGIKKWLSDKWVIYMSMIYPVLFWHLKSDRNFSWFETGDFVNLKTLMQQIPGFSTHLLDQVLMVANVLYWLVLCAWLAEEIWRVQRHQIHFSTGKVLWVFTTAVNWYLGIVYFNSAPGILPDQRSGARRAVHGAGLLLCATKKGHKSSPGEKGFFANPGPLPWPGVSGHFHVGRGFYLGVRRRVFVGHAAFQGEGWFFRKPVPLSDERARKSLPPGRCLCIVVHSPTHSLCARWPYLERQRQESLYKTHFSALISTVVIFFRSVRFRSR